MAQAAIEGLLKQCGSIYRLVILAARRAKELAEGAHPLVDAAHQKKVASIALEEILQDRVLYKAEGAEAGAGKKGRHAYRQAGGAKAKEEKKKRTPQ